MPKSLPLIRTSERGDFKTCQFYWYQRWVRGLTSEHTATALWFGTAIHKALEVRYPIGRKRGRLSDVLAAFEAFLGDEVRRMYLEGDNLDDVEIVDARALGISMLRGYVQFWGKDSHWEVVHCEQTFQVDVPHWRTGRTLATYCGTWDLVVWDRVDKKFYVVDHKTRRSFPRIWTFYDLNDQAGSYLWVAPEVLRNLGIMRKGQHLEGIVFNCLRKKMPDDRERNAEGLCLNKNGTVSKRQPAPLYARYTSHRTAVERVAQARHVVAEVQQMNAVRSGKMIATKHPTEQCPRCPFFDMCLLDERSREDAQVYAQGMYRTTDPYADHREAMREGGIHL